MTSSLCGGAERVDRLGVVLAVAPQLGPARPASAATADVAHAGERRVDRRGELVGRVVGGRPPRPAGSTGRASANGRRQLEAPAHQVEAVVEEQLGRLERRRAAGAARPTAATASSTSAKASRATTRSVGGGTSRSRAAVTTPSVPSLPHRRPARS